MSILSSNTEFGAKLKALKLAYGLTNLELSRYGTIVNESNISKTSISFWENGKRSPSIDSALLIANIFAVSLNWLIAHEDYPEKPIYDEIRLEYLESKLIERGQNYLIRGEEYPFPYFEILSKEYLDGEQRRVLFPKEARANIIFFMYIIDFEWQRYIKAHITEFKSWDEITIKNVIMRIFDFGMTVPGDLDAIRAARKNIETIMENKKPICRVRW